MRLNEHATENAKFDYSTAVIKFEKQLKKPTGETRATIRQSLETLIALKLKETYNNNVTVDGYSATFRDHIDSRILKSVTIDTPDGQFTFKLTPHSAGSDENDPNMTWLYHLSFKEIQDLAQKFYTGWLKQAGMNC